MIYTLPAFNLFVNLWHGGNVPPALPDVVTVGNLTPGRRTITPFVLAPAGAQDPANMWLLVPRGTDIRDAKGGTGNDLAEVPAGSGRFYDVEFVDDIASGFANEHRFGQLRGLGPWPVPFPRGNAAIPIVGGASCVFATVVSNGILYRTIVAPGALDHFILGPVSPVVGSLVTPVLSDDGNHVLFQLIQALCQAPITPLVAFFTPGSIPVFTSALAPNFIYFRLGNASGTTAAIVDFTMSW